ncbi:MAG: hypothetical protein ABI891_09175 [Acidobacteriota bacterium]
MKFSNKGSSIILLPFLLQFFDAGYIVNFEKPAGFNLVVIDFAESLIDYSDAKVSNTKYPNATQDVTRLKNFRQMKELSILGSNI